MILAGGQGSRLGLLSSQRAKPAVPFGGVYRLIDFTLSNAMHSDVRWIGIMTQYRPGSLMTHLELGTSWNFYGPFRKFKILPPQFGIDDRDWYQGTSDAIFQNMAFIHRFDVDLVLILSGDHIYRDDYNNMIDFHRKTGADLTIAGIEVPRHMVSQFGIISTDPRGRIIDFVEKPAESKSRTASMGVYVFRRDVLEDELTRAKKLGLVDFGKHIIPQMITNRRVFMYPFNGYWRDVGTIESYWESNMDILRDLPEFDLAKWNVFTNHEFLEKGVRKASVYSENASVMNSFISDGCVINGQVISSILSPGVVVEENAVVSHSVIFDDTVIQKESKVHCAIIDKKCMIGAQTVIGESIGIDWDPVETAPPDIAVIAKGVSVPPQSTIEAGVQIDLGFYR